MTERSGPPGMQADALSRALAGLRPPVLVVSTVVGRGMHSLGQALCERLARLGLAHHHLPIEELLPAGAWQEDVARYRLISSTWPGLLNLVYRVPIFYQRKLWRERYLRSADLGLVSQAVARADARTVLCVSHRPAFWLSALRRRGRHPFSLWGLLGEYGPSLGWRYIFWRELAGFLTPVPEQALGFRLPPGVRPVRIALPARQAFYALARQAASPHRALLVAGYWGQLRFDRTLRALLRAAPGLTVEVVCGENQRARRALQARYAADRRVQVHGVVESLLPLLARCASVITKPGISTLVEAHAARRKIFLLPGMPVAEDHNASYAVAHLGADWFTPRGFARWRAGAAPGAG